MPFFGAVMIKEFYSKNHIRLVMQNETQARLFYTSHGIAKAGKILFIDLCDDGETLCKNGNFGDVEGFKGVFELLSPVDCVALRANEEILTNPSTLTENDWLVEIELSSPLPHLMTVQEYGEFIKNDTYIREKR